MPGLPSGGYRVRAMDLFGRLTFASGMSIRPDAAAGHPTRLWAKIDLDDPNCREVMGFVRWESGLPVEKAPVVMQNSQNFRKFVRRVETDEHGFYHFTDVPGGEPYFIFALPPGVDGAMRNFEYFFVASYQHEVWSELTLHPHRVTGGLTHAGSEQSLQLVRLGAKEEPVLWTSQADGTGQFVVANVPHGRYRLRVLSQNRADTAASVPFDVEEGKEEAAVRWSEASP